MDTFGIVLNVALVGFTGLWAFTQFKLWRAQREIQALSEGITSLLQEELNMLKCLHRHETTSECISEMQNWPVMIAWKKFMVLTTGFASAQPEDTKHVH